ncbi:MAG: NOB1 family endonuclease [Candidatus Heimdallarchaeaceae archaeon]|jgi:UPF0271 protein
MNEHKKTNREYIITDSTAIIHILAKEELENDNIIYVVPSIVKDELKSIQARTTLELLEAKNVLMFADPSSESLEKIVSSALETGDLESLSEQDKHILALSLDYLDSIVMSDDNAIQNVCLHMNIPVKPYVFKIKEKRNYFWKCTVCGKRFVTKKNQCIECGSPVKRFYSKKK